MTYLLVRHGVADFTEWRRVFDSHAEAQREAGLELLHVLRDKGGRNLVVLLFRVHDLNKARAFVEARSASESAEISGVIGVPEISFLSE